MQNKAGEERNIAIDVYGQELEQVRDFKIPWSNYN